MDFEFEGGTSYTSFASVYDMYMDNVPYDTWCDHILALFKKYDMPLDIVADLGCGTGQITRRLHAAGFDMIGIDLSYDMLMEAQTAYDSEGILYLCQDMRDFELYGTVGAVVSICDSINYLESKEDLLTVCRLVDNYLDPGGLFIFDVNTVYKYENILGNNTFAENRDEGSFIWENEYDSDTRDNAYYLTLYMRNQDDLYERYEEEHLQHAFTRQEIEDCLKEAHLELLEVLDVDTMGPVSEKTERMYFVAKETTKVRN